MTDLLDLLAAITDNPHPLGDAEKERIHDAIYVCAFRNGWIVDPNHVRAELTNEHGLTVNPRRLSATYSKLRHDGTLQPISWTTNDDVHGGNAGKPLRLYRYKP